METYRKPQHEIRGEPAAAATGGVAGGLGALQQLQAFVRRLQALTFLVFLGALEQLQAFVRSLIQALTTFFLFLGGLLLQLIEFEVVPRLQAAAFFLFQGCSRGIGALRQVVEPEDRHLQAAAFFLACGGCVVLHGTAVNRSVNPEHLFAGFVLFTIGGVMAILTLAGGGAGRAADRMERFLRGFF